jgi:hypothetical protein
LCARGLAHLCAAPGGGGRSGYLPAPTRCPPFRVQRPTPAPLSCLSADACMPVPSRNPLCPIARGVTEEVRNRQRCPTVTPNAEDAPLLLLAPCSPAPALEGTPHPTSQSQSHPPHSQCPSHLSAEHWAGARASAARVPSQRQFASHHDQRSTLVFGRQSETRASFYRLATEGDLNGIGL